MLKKSDLNDTSKYKKWSGFVNIGYISGWADNIHQTNQIWTFDLRQTPYKDQKIRVVMNDGDYLPAYFKDHDIPPVKIICRIQQDKDLQYNSLVIRPIYLDEPSIIEMPTPESFIALGKDNKTYKTFNPYLTYSDLTNLSANKMENATKKFVNNIEITGIVIQKTHISNTCFSFLVQSGESRIINARYYGKTSNAYFNSLELFSPIALKGEMHSRFSDKTKNDLEVYLKVKNINSIIKPGINFPRKVPVWYEALVEKSKVEAEESKQTEDISLKEDYTEPLFEAE